MPRSLTPCWFARELPAELYRFMGSSTPPGLTTHFFRALLEPTTELVDWENNADGQTVIVEHCSLVPRTDAALLG